MTLQSNDTKIPQNYPMSPCLIPIHTCCLSRQRLRYASAFLPVCVPIFVVFMSVHVYTCLFKYVCVCVSMPMNPPMCVFLCPCAHIYVCQSVCMCLSCLYTCGVCGYVNVTVCVSLGGRAYMFVCLCL